MTRATFAGLGVLLVTWVALAFVVWEIVAAAAGREAAMRLVPYVNAHLLEEASEGAYSPWRDPVFLVRLLANTVMPYAAAGWVAGRIHRRGPIPVLVLGAAALLVLHRHVFMLGFPSAVRAGFLLELATAGATVTVVAAWARRTTTSAA